MAVDNPISFLDLPPELRSQIYKTLFEEVPYRTIRTDINSWREKTRIIRPKVDSYWGWGLYSRYSPVKLFLSNKQVYQEAVHAFYTHLTFEAFIHLGEKDWQTIYKWLEMIGPQNRKNLRKIEIEYDCLEWAPILEDGEPGQRWVTDLYGRDKRRPTDWLKLSPTGGWVERISPTIEKIFKLLGECHNVMVTFKPDRWSLLGRLLYPELYEAEHENDYPNTWHFEMTPEGYWKWDPYPGDESDNCEYESDIGYDGDLYGGYNFYGPQTRSLLPDLMELYRTRYGADSIRVLWMVEIHWDPEDISRRRDMIERSGWDILHFECDRRVTMQLRKRLKKGQELAAQSTGDLGDDINLCERWLEGVE
jgi:hypothetical protein